MARNRKNQSAAIRFAPALKVTFLCMLVAGSAIGYVWQKNEIDRLGSMRAEREKSLIKLNRDNQRMTDQLAILHSPVMLDQRVRELNLGMVPAQPMQVTRLVDPVNAPPGATGSVRPLAERPLETAGQ
jgi:hypothetical protein